MLRQSKVVDKQALKEIGKLVALRAMDELNVELESISFKKRTDLREVLCLIHEASKDEPFKEKELVCQPTQNYWKKKVNMARLPRLLVASTIKKICGNPRYLCSTLKEGKNSTATSKRDIG
ncbi:MAG: hypothetical protein IPL73_23635 [Candidatus Obscuribacter sp.]|nr:hypothetical protein [Candidatus Obscuribacter sp.]